MDKVIFKKDTIITAEKGKYLKLIDIDNSEEVIGKPQRIIFSNDGIIPNCEEVEL